MGLPAVSSYVLSLDFMAIQPRMVWSAECRYVADKHQRSDEVSCRLNRQVVGIFRMFVWFICKRCETYGVTPWLHQICCP